MYEWLPLVVIITFVVYYIQNDNCIYICCMYYSHTFTGSHWLPVAESTTSTHGYPYKVLLPHFQACDVEWWGGRHAGVCGGSGSAPPILNGVLWVGQPTQVSWRRPGDPDCSWGGQWCQWDHVWSTHCSKEMDRCLSSQRSGKSHTSCSLELVCHCMC